MGTSLDNAVIFAEKIRETVQKEIKFLEDRDITIRIGVTEISKTDTGDSLFKRADENLYKAKETGRNKVVGTAGN